MTFSARFAARGRLARLAILAALLGSFMYESTAHAQTCNGDITGDGVVDGEDLAIVLANWGPCPSTVDSVLPQDGSPFGGTVLEIRGQGLGTTSAVLVGGVPCTKVSVVSPTFVVATTPPGQPGFASVAVVTAAGTTTVKNGFHYGRMLPWATVLEYWPDPAVVTDELLRDAITYSGFPWRIRDNSSQIEMLLVPPAQFLRGCSPSDQFECDPDEYPAQIVTLSNYIYVGRFEVTQAQWMAKMGANPSHFQAANGWPGSDDRPVENISWNQLSAFDGFLSSTGLRLLTEAEWERTYRAAYSPFSSMAFHSMPGQPDGTNDDTLAGEIAWFDSNSKSRTHPVGQKASNALGFHDMAGNVAEWVSDYWGFYSPTGPTNDPTGPASGSERVIRGGSYLFNTNFLRSSKRDRSAPVFNWSDVGIRVARTP
jgi:formylglycine-generating enzyme required for sulfatase activity